MLQPYCRRQFLAYPRNRLIDRFKRGMINHRPQRLKYRRILQRIEPRSFAFVIAASFPADRFGPAPECGHKA
jgi:hypothetical protein